MITDVITGFVLQSYMKIVIVLLLWYFYHFNIVGGVGVGVKKNHYQI